MAGFLIVSNEVKVFAEERNCAGTIVEFMKLTACEGVTSSM